MDKSTATGLIIGAVALAMFVIGIALIVSGRRMKTRCRACTTGAVEGLSAQCAGDIHLLKIGYNVDGETYHVAGPKFTSAAYVKTAGLGGSVKAQFESNIAGCEPGNLPTKLRYRMRSNGIASIVVSPLLEMFPVGTQVDVFYDPDRPRTAYAMRWCTPTRQIGGVIMIGIGAIVLALACLVAFVL